MSIRAILRTAVISATLASLTGCVVYEASVQTAPNPAPPPPRPPVSVTVASFYDALDPDGDWLWIEPYGWVWLPNVVDPFWRPYTVGRWEWTDWGWAWVSAERWGWATYHYGRWVRAPHHGWAWIPGDVWGPAWVAWRSGPGVVGWAPLPPEVRYRAGVGLDWGGVDIDIAIHLDQWCFVDDVHFTEREVYRHAYPVGRNTTTIRATRDATRVAVREGKIVNEGIDRGAIERARNRPLPSRRVVDHPSADRRPAEVTPDEVRVYRPEVKPGPPDAAPPRGRKPGETARPPADPTVDKDAERRWDRGWGKDWDKLEKLQKRGETSTPVPPAQRRPEALERVRDENMDAAENAYRELVAERDRARRKAERLEKKPVKKQGESSERKK